MDIIKQLNNAIAYIEENLCDEIETSRIVETSLSTRLLQKQNRRRGIHGLNVVR